MAENVAKAAFLNFLLKAKHGIAPQNPPVFRSHAEDLGAPAPLADFSSDMAPPALDAWLAAVEPALPLATPALNDLLFGMLFSSDEFVRRVRAKDTRFPAITAAYRAAALENRKYIAEHNRRDCGKLNITAPALVRTRFPPEPSGFLHIGHAKAALLNQQLASPGELIVRMDDTNPLRESALFEEAIREDLALLGITEYRLTHSSDYFDRLIEYAETLIERGLAYADDTPQEEMHRLRAAGLPSPRRETPPAESLRIFRAMRAGECPAYCLRARIAHDSPNGALRDPVIYRATAVPHPRTGTRYRVYPTYDFTVPIVDSLEGVTLTLRTNEYRDRNALYYWFYDALGLSGRPRLHDFSRLTFDNTVVSKRKLKFYVDGGFVEGWDDPRLCTLRGLRRRGMLPAVLVEYVRQQGASQKTAVNSWDKIWALNKRAIDPLSARISAVPLAEAVRVRVAGAGTAAEVVCPRHKKNPALGTKRVVRARDILLAQEDVALLRAGEEITLMGWANAVYTGAADAVEAADATDASVTAGVARLGVSATPVTMRLNPDGDFKTTTHKLTWVAEQGAVRIRVREYGELLNGAATDDLAAQFNKDSLRETWWLAEPAVADIQPGDFIQIERVGFFYCDRPYEFNLVPYTRQRRTRVAE